MMKKIITFSLCLVFIILSLILLINSAIFENSVPVSATHEVDAEFLSDEYFNELHELFEQVKTENSKGHLFDNSKKIAAEAVINKMMDDLEKKPDALKSNKNFSRFFETFDGYILKLDSITERMHFFRNTLNSYSNAPTKLDDIITLAAKGEWKIFSAKFHRYNYGEINGALNIKFISKDGRFEAVYNRGTGEIVDDPANMGTYNYAPGSVNPVKYFNHNKYDKEPWKKWGNIKGFSYENIMKLESAHGTDEADNNYKEVERLIKERKDELKSNSDK